MSVRVSKRNCVLKSLALMPNTAQRVALLALGLVVLHQSLFTLSFGRIPALQTEEGQVDVLIAVTEHLIFSEAEADVAVILNTRDARGQTPLFIASSMGHFECVRFLLTNGADRTLGDSKGNLPIHIACLHGYSLLVMLLLDFGSPEQVSEAAGTVHRGNISGLTPLHLAVWGRHPNSVVLLLQHGADLSARAQRQRIPDIVPCHSGTTPLMLAAVRGAVDIARLILLSYYERVVEPMQRNIAEGAPPPAVVEEDPRCHVNENGNQAWELANQLGFRSFAAMLMPRFELSRLFANRDASHSRLCGPKSLCYIATMVHNKKLEAELLCIVEANKNLVGPSCIKPSLKPPPRLSPVEEQPSWPSVLPPTSTRSTPMRVDQAILPGSPLVDRDSLAAVQRRLEDVEDGTQGILMGLERMESALRSISVLTSAVEREPWRGEAQPERSRGSGLVVPPALTIDFIQRLSNDRNSVASSLGHHDIPVSRRDKRASRLGKLSAASTPDVSTHNGHSHDVQKEELEVTDAWEECGVCFETLPPVRLEPCRHEVCVECALQLVKKGGEDAKACMTTCPFCRAIVKSFVSEAVI